MGGRHTDTQTDKVTDDTDHSTHASGVGDYITYPFIKQLTTASGEKKTDL